MASPPTRSPGALLKPFSFSIGTGLALSSSPSKIHHFNVSPDVRHPHPSLAFAVSGNLNFRTTQDFCSTPISVGTRHALSAPIESKQSLELCPKIGLYSAFSALGFSAARLALASGGINNGKHL